jgi:hypothetical protein
LSKHPHKNPPFRNPPNNFIHEKRVFLPHHPSHVFMQKLLFFSLILFFTQLQAQYTTFAPSLKIQGNTLSNPWGGGLNAPQVSEADLDGDGQKDLYVFDRLGDVHLAFRRVNGAWMPANELVSNFPKADEWAMIRDYNGDGVADLFTYSDIPGIDGVAVFVGSFQSGRLRFRRYPFRGPFPLASFPLSTGGTAQIYVSRVDLPDINDVDCDGDLDILTFSLGGSYMEYYQNQSVERGFKRDSLQFLLKENCYGGFFESGLQPDLNLAPAIGQCFRQDAPGLRSGLHAGSTTTSFDADRDGDLDLFIGDISFPNLIYLQNGGNCARSWINQQEVNFPKNSKAASIPYFPAAFFADLNADGSPELLAAPNEVNIVEDVKVLWVYGQSEPAQAQSFVYQRDNFLVGDMLDLGTGAYPAVADVNADGLPDLVIGNNQRYLGNGQRACQLSLLLNVGSAKNPQFELSNPDWLNMSQYSRTNLAFIPSFGDLDADGDLDLLVGEELGTLFFAENTAGPGKAMQFAAFRPNYAKIDVGFGAAPQIVDLNEDKLPDLVIGDRNGRVNYFQNLGTSSQARFNDTVRVAPNIQRLGRVDATIAGDFIGYATPHFFKQKGQWRLLLGNDVGQMRLYDRIEGNFNGTFRLIDTLLGQIRVGMRYRPILADLDADGQMELIVGNLRGGLNLFRSPFLKDVSTANRQVRKTQTLQFYPNPVHDWVTLTGLAPKAKVNVFDALGRQVYAPQENLGDTWRINLHNLPSAWYLIRAQADDKVWVGKVLRQQ